MHSATVLELHTDVAVIGAGTAGLSAYRAARREGASALMIEGGPYGTTCARVGCMPSKLLIAAAEGMHGLERLATFGIDAPAARVDGVRVMQRVRQERDRFVGFVLDSVEAIDAKDKLRGWARFVDSKTVLVDLEQATAQGQTQALVHCQSVVLATGSSPHTPEALVSAGDRLVVNDDVFEWTDLPRSVFVVGAGVIGLELGQALSRLGVQVTLIGRKGNIGGISDPEVRTAAQSIFAKEFDYIPDAEVLSAVRASSADAGVHVTYRDADGQEHSKTVDYVLSAAGRRPNLARLGLDAQGLGLEAQSVPSFDTHTMQMTHSPATAHLFIAGDANNQLTLLHEAADEGAIAGRNAARIAKGLSLEAGLRRSFLGVVFSDPNIATVGSSYRELDLHNTAIGEVSFKSQGRARVMLMNEGVLRVYADKRSRRFVGAEMIAPRAEHLAHLLAWAHQMQLTIDQMLAMPFYHPVIEEGLRTALREVAAQLDAA